MKVSYSAPGKIILSGEHAVVYGKPAIVTAIDKELVCTVEDSHENSGMNRNIRYVDSLVRDYLQTKKKNIREVPFKIRISSNIPKKRGMGSSAAFSVATVAALLEFRSGQNNFSKEAVNNLAFKVEKKFHKNPSGVDQTTSCFGGLVFFRKEFEFLKGIYHLSYKIPPKIEDYLYIVDSGVPIESTGTMVEIVGRRYNSNPKKTERIFAEIEKTTKRLTVAIVKEDKNFFDAQIKRNGELLDEIGVVSTAAKDLVNKLSAFGVTKVTGAGGEKTGSGFLLLSLANSDKKRAFVDFAKKNNISYLKLRQSFSGLRRVESV